MGVRRSYQRSQSDPECLSSSEQSCDTVIYVGGGGVAPPALSDRDLTDSETASSVITVQLPPPPPPPRLRNAVWTSFICLVCLSSIA